MAVDNTNDSVHDDNIETGVAIMFFVMVSENGGQPHTLSAHKTKTEASLAMWRLEQDQPSRPGRYHWIKSYPA